jgi:hypothetical protein
METTIAAMSIRANRMAKKVDWRVGLGESC